MAKKRSRPKSAAAEEAAEVEAEPPKMAEKKKKEKTQNARSNDESAHDTEKQSSHSPQEKNEAPQDDYPKKRNKAMAFRTLDPPLSKGVLKYLKAQNFHTMTPVQAASIPLFLTHKDVAAQACTGSGTHVLLFCALVVVLQVIHAKNLKLTLLCIRETLSYRQNTGLFDSHGRNDSAPRSAL